MAKYGDFGKLRAFHRDYLLKSVVPFWMEHAIDREQGGLFTCIRDDGTIVNTDKYMWSQLRGVWTFSALYNRIEKRDEWLEVAARTVEFALANGRDDAGRWVFHTDRAGTVIEGATSIYADGFALMGFTEYGRATGEKRAIDAARETAQSVRERLAVPGSYLTAPYVIPPGAKAHGIPMIFSIALDELGDLLDDDDLRQAGCDLAREVMDHFRRPAEKLLFEFVNLDGSPLDTPEGRAVVPGHAIESMWFMIHIFRKRGETERINEAIETIHWHVERGWDGEHGGIRLAIDSLGGTPAWPQWDKKPWWPHTEALYALLLAYEYCREPWCLQWYERVHDWAWEHYPDEAHGEWTQRLTREGEKTDELIALPVKDPFHLPRALMMCIDVLGRLAGVT